MIKLKYLLWNLFIPLDGGTIVGILTKDSMDVYNNIARPPLAPPPIAFPIVWSILYILMGISSYLIYESKSIYNEKSLYVYYIQLILNFTWPFIFFSGKMFLVAFFVLLLLWGMVIWMTGLFYKIKPAAAYLQIPYLIWLGFAAYLNLSIGFLNM